MKFDKDEIKNNLTIEQIIELVEELGGEPVPTAFGFIAKTICHGGDSHKLYYYSNTNLFKCYTGCDNTGGFDIFELIQKNRSRELNQNWNLYQSIKYVISFFHLSIEEENDFSNLREELPDWNILNNYEKQIEIKEQKVELKYYDENILKYLPKPHIIPWENEGISYDIILSRGICYNPKNESIIIPHRDIDGKLVGIRERTLIKEQEVYGKYRPAVINNIMFKHPLSFNLYNINNSKDAIKAMKKAIVFEGEKGCLSYASYFGIDNDISVACCGSSLISYQVKLLLSLGVEEIIIAFDRQFQKLGDAEWEKWTTKLEGFHNKYSKYVKISYMFDKNNLLGYKDSPIDKGPETFLKLYKDRFSL